MKKVQQIFIIMIALGFILTPILVLAEQKLGIEPTQIKEKVSETVAEQKININTATIEQLQNLPGVGQTIGQRIIDYRNKHGLFQKTEDIMQVRGIGEERFEKIKDLITVGKEIK